MSYRATPEQWAEAANHASKNYGAAWQCLLELRARVEALEDSNWQQEVRWNSKPTPNDRQIRSSLVERVEKRIRSAHNVGGFQARAAIREVARWMDENQSPVTAQWLEEEAER